ncbi:MAG: GNAT family N-acetyltransferase [Defluviitaleaceae bacterium]|nr:GNAT family N-acetyltransferase [Defluviitaleaceae bacterium]
MEITYSEAKKDLPAEQLHRLFFLAGWAGDEPVCDPEALPFFSLPFINSTVVVSAWAGERLVGAVRVLSDKLGRSVIYDLVVDPEYQRKGIGSELARRCVAHYPDSEWSLETSEKNVGFYEKIGFGRSLGTHLRIKGKYQPK